MDPNQQNQPSGFDYLDQIAPKQEKQSFIKRLGILQYVVIGVLAILVIVVLVAVVNNASTGPMKHLAGRLTTTGTIAEKAQVNLKSSELRTLNSNLKIYLTNTNRDIKAPFKEVGITTTKLDADIVRAEAGTNLSARLEDARLNAKFDAYYAKEMSYQLNTIMILMKQIYSSTGNKNVKTFLEGAYTNLEPMQKSFSDFNAANG